MERVASEAQVRVFIRDESDVAVARRRARELASQQGLSEVEAEALATAVTEIARNIVVHAGGGEILFERVVDAPRRGVVVIARDTGPGIPDVEQAMQDGFSTKRGLGFGLPGARRLVDKFEIESKAGAGTTVTLRKWAAAKSQ
ncbi:MAG: anti-sigma regulatory factor [Betaproteobacteria bacterium]|nr:MAG: anti-sigma regulatory factor [Betaproteobacteria bacterium]TMH90153.1 MAG: anti-sigma regulatory factor [Betaproteobacteria bacterium]